MGWRRFFRRRQWDEERKRELEAHLALEADENEARGLSPEQARYAARRKLGNPARIREEIYLMNSAGVVDTLFQDLRYGVRQLRADRGFTITAVLTLALGIGAVTVMYSVIHNVLLDPFPYRDSARMVDVVVRDSERPDAVFRGALTPAEFLDFQEQSAAFEDVIGTETETMVLRTAERAEPVDVAWATPNLFDFLGVAPLRGRRFDEADAQPGAPPTAVLSHGAWLRLFGGDPDIVGRTIVLNGAARSVIGVMPPRFTWHVADAWLPSAVERGAPETRASSRWFQARLRRGVSVEQAEAELNVIAARRAQERPQDYPERFRIDVITVIDWVVGRFRGVLYSLFGAVSLLLLIACVNVANMLLARATVREREITIRAAIGASRARIVRQLLVESLLLALAGGAAGWLLAWGALRTLLTVLPRQGVASEVEIALDGPVLLFSIAASASASVVFGLLPALHGARRDLVTGLKQGGRGIAGGFRSGGTKSVLVIGEVALSLVLLLGAGLLMRSFLRMVSVDVGFDPSNKAWTYVTFAPGHRTLPAERHAFFRQAREALATLPGVVAVAEATGTPLGGFESSLHIPGRAQAARPTALVQLCSEGYLQTFGLRLVRGRDFTEADVAGARRVALVNQALVAAHFGDEDPIGRTIVLDWLGTIPDPVSEPAFEILGVVSDARQGARPGSRPQPAAFLPATVTGSFNRAVAVRTAADPRPLLEPIRRTLTTLDSGVALYQSQVLADMLRRRHAQPRFSLIVLASFATIGLLLVGVGVYGVMAYTVARQRQEIAVRMALGAGRGHVLALVLLAGGRLLAAGTAAGLLLSLGAGRLIESQLWETSPHDAATLLLAVAVVGGIGLLACYVPAARAVRVDPVVALRLD